MLISLRETRNQPSTRTLMQHSVGSPSNIALQATFRWVGETSAQAIHQPSILDISPDENSATFALHIWCPITLWHTAEMTIDSMKHIFLFHPRHIQDAFHAIH